MGHAAADGHARRRERATDGSGRPRGCRTPRPDTGSRCSSATGAPVLDPTPWVGNVKPFLIQSSSQFRSAPPPALDSAQWATEFNEVKSLGRATGSTRTDDQTYIAKWWQSAPVSELERSRPAAHRPDRPRRRRQREAPRAAEPERRGRGDQLLERQVPLRLLAAVERDPTSGGGREPRDGSRPDLDGAHHRAVSRVGLGPQLPRRRKRHRAADVLRRRPRRVALPDHEHSS